MFYILMPMAVFNCQRYNITLIYKYEIIDIFLELKL